MSSTARTKRIAPRQHEPAELAKREEAFRLYRDLGVNRTYARLLAILPRRFGGVAERTLTNWAREGDWRDRCDEYDRRVMAADFANLDPQFDQLDHLLKAAHLVLTKALNASVDVIPTKPGEIKQLIDAGRNAIVLCQKLMEMRQGGRDDTGRASKAMMFAELEKVEQRIRDVLAAEAKAWRHARACEAMLREHGLEPPSREDVITIEATPVVVEQAAEEVEIVTTLPKPIVELPRAEQHTNVEEFVKRAETVAERLAAFRSRQQQA